MLEIKAEGKDLRTWLNDHVSGMKSVEMKERGAIDLDTKAAKGFIYAAKNSADFSTLEHEFQHLWAVTDKKASENLAKVMHSVADDKRFQEYVANHKDVVKMKVDDVIDTMRKMGEDASKWTRDEAEVVATLYELYKQNGKTFNEKLKSIFEQIAEWFHRIYQALKREGMLNEELIKAYDAYFDKDAEFRKTAEKAEQKAEIKNQEATSTHYQLNKENQNKDFNKIRESITSYQDLADLAKKDRPYMVEVIKELADLFGINENDVSYRRDIKSQKSTESKVRKDYNGDYSSVKDMIGATFVVDEVDTNPLFEAIINSNLLDIYDYKSPKSKNSYWDYKINYKLPNGSIGELIIVDPYVMAMKNTIGHPLYEMSRLLQEQSSKENLTKEQFNLVYSLINQLLELSSDVYTNQTWKLDSNSKALSEFIIELDSGRELIAGLSTSLDEALSQDNVTNLQSLLEKAFNSKPDSSVSHSINLDSYLSKSERFNLSSSDSNKTQNDMTVNTLYQSAYHGSGAEFDPNNPNIYYQGYNWDRGMSNNAVSAYENGEKPMSKWTKEEIDDEIDFSDFSDSIKEKLKNLPMEAKKENLLEYSSWHHTGKFFNETKFYKFIDLSDYTENDIEDFIERYKDYKPKLKEYNKQVKQIKEDAKAKGYKVREVS